MVRILKRLLGSLTVFGKNLFGNLIRKSRKELRKESRIALEKSIEQTLFNSIEFLNSSRLAQDSLEFAWR